ncbi:uncharacterized protein J2S58_000366 [Nakamurella flavida]|nr:Tex family protein [Nakamurella flavida]MDP9776743.1 uncharacterized protein [Nakamurella flavida]
MSSLVPPVPDAPTTPPLPQVAPVPVPSVARRIADELAVALRQVQAAIDLLDGGATVPFVARYRKEATGGLDDAQLRTLQERLDYLRELDERRDAVLASIAGQGALTVELARALAAADTKSRVEDIYLPFKPRRRTRAQIAREAGLGPLAAGLLADPSQDPRQVAALYVDADRGVADVDAVLTGARSILSETFGEDADLIGELRERLWREGRLTSAVKDGREVDGEKFRDYFAFTQPVRALPSHRVLALLRGESEGVLDLAIGAAEEPTRDAGPGPFERAIAARFGIAARGRAADAWLLDAVRWTWRTRLFVSLAVDVRARLRAAAEESAAAVFAANLRDVLLAAPAGGRTTLGLDPGLRTGVKVAVVDGTGRVLATDTVYPHVPHRRRQETLDTLRRLVRVHGVELIAIGNGTASRETDQLAGELIAALAGDGVTGVRSVVVSEAGASVYSASALAGAELPGMDVSLRGAVSIARRLQDPLAELVKIDPKSIGVGQYQHDLTPGLLARHLDSTVEDCVNAVGVDVNTASVPLLARVSGISGTVAENIVAHREANGPFPTRRALNAVPRLGPKAYEQSAGFLRIAGGADPLDASGVHPEAYPVVRRILAATGTAVDSLIGNTAVLTALRPTDFTDERFGVPTVADILAELDKPGRDPRPEFRTATFTADVQTIGDVRPGMVLEGVVTNVAAFGAFVDIGVHQDGLVHVSALADTFVADPRDVVRSGQVVRVKVLEVDPQRKRISLTMRLQDPVEGAGPDGAGHGGSGRRDRGAGRGAPGGGGTGAGRAAGRSAGGGGGQSGAAATERRSDGRPADQRRGPRREGGTGGTPKGPAGGRGTGQDDRSGDRRPGGSLADALRQAGWRRDG